MATRPNILVILADDHGYGDISAHGGPHLQTPNIDRIGAEGCRLTHCYANSSVCSPSRAALMTGRYPDRVGVPGVIRTHANNSWGYFRRDAVTLPQVLGAQGYRTWMSGKWHLGLEAENHPNRRGFATFKGFLGDMMDDYLTHRRHDNNYMRDGEREIDPAGHATDLFTGWAIDMIRDHAKRDEPFFGYLAYNAPHTPIQPPAEWVAKVREREPDADDKRVKYVALVEHMDHGIGRVLDTLADTGVADHTIVIYTSDNGGEMGAGATNGDLRGQKGDMYEGGIRVPACVRWPGEVPAASVSNQVMLLSDLFPSLCEAAEARFDHAIDGTSVLPTFRGGQQNLSDRLLYWLRREGGPQFTGEAQHAVRRGDLKLLHNRPFEPLQLFDLAGDPHEITDLTKTRIDDWRALRQDMQSRILASGGVPWVATG
jgi:arylsulfatase A-like enzyme